VWTIRTEKMEECGGLAKGLRRVSSPKTSVIFFLERENRGKGLENPRRLWNNGGSNKSSLFQPSEAFE
jgi:hypothetical protein